MNISISKFLILLLFHVSCGENIVNPGCELAGGDFVICAEFTSGHLSYSDEYANVTNIDISGSSNQLYIDPRFKRLQSLRLMSSNWTKLAFGDFSTFEELTEIDIEFSSIDTISTDGVETMTSLRKLFMYGCDVNTMTSSGFSNFPALQDFRFASCNFNGLDFNLFPVDLQYLDLRQTQFASFSCEKLKSLTKLRTLDLGATSLEEFDFTCVPMSITRLSMDLNEMTKFRFNALQSLTSLESLSLNYNRLATFNMAHLPPNLVSLDMYLNNITSLECDDVTHLTQLEEINLAQNGMTNIDYRCIPHTVRRLYLNQNRLTHVPCGELQKFTQLTYIDVQDNQLQEFDFTCINKGVRSVIIKSNNITNIDINSLYELPRVTVEMSNNPINCTCSLLVDYYKMLELDSLPISCWTSECLSCDPKSQLGGYQLSKNMSFLRGQDDQNEACLLSQSLVSDTALVLEGGCMFEDDLMTPRMRCTDFTSTTIAYNEEAASLQSLDVRGDFSELQIDARYSDILYIKLQSDTLESFNFSTVSEFPRLQIVDLSSNRISTLHTGNTTASSELRRIVLNNNEIPRVVDGGFQHFQQLEELVMRHNKLEIFHISDLPQSIVKVDVSHNRIVGFVFTDVEGWERIKILDLSWNRLKHFAFNMAPNNLEELVLNNNDLTTVTFESRLPLLNLLRVDLAVNLINCDCDLYTSLATMRQKKVELLCPNDVCFNCRPGSPLADYPWHDVDVVEPRHCSTTPSSGHKANGFVVFVFAYVILVLIDLL